MNNKRSQVLRFSFDKFMPASHIIDEFKVVIAQICLWRIAICSDERLHYFPTEPSFIIFSTSAEF